MGCRASIPAGRSIDRLGEVPSKYSNNTSGELWLLTLRKPQGSRWWHGILQDCCENWLVVMDLENDGRPSLMDPTVHCPFLVCEYTLTTRTGPLDNLLSAVKSGRFFSGAGWVITLCFDDTYPVNMSQCARSHPEPGQNRPDAATSGLFRHGSGTLWHVCAFLLLKLEYSIGSVTWLLMPWFLLLPGHQQQWYWICTITHENSVCYGLLCMYQITQVLYWNRNIPG